MAPDGPVVAGSVGQWTITYTVGSYGIDEGGTTKFGQRYASDWEIPQFDAPTEPGDTVTIGLTAWIAALIRQAWELSLNANDRRIGGTSVSEEPGG